MATVEVKPEVMDDTVGTTPRTMKRQRQFISRGCKSALRTEDIRPTRPKKRRITEVKLEEEPDVENNLNVMESEALVNRIVVKTEVASGVSNSTQGSEESITPKDSRVKEEPRDLDCNTKINDGQRVKEELIDQGIEAVVDDSASLASNCTQDSDDSVSVSSDCTQDSEDSSNEEGGNQVEQQQQPETMISGLVAELTEKPEDSLTSDNVAELTQKPEESLTIDNVVVNEQLQAPMDTQSCPEQTAATDAEMPAENEERENQVEEQQLEPVIPLVASASHHKGGLKRRAANDDDDDNVTDKAPHTKCKKARKENAELSTAFSSKTGRTKRTENRKKKAVLDLVPNVNDAADEQEGKRNAAPELVGEAGHSTKETSTFEEKLIRCSVSQLIKCSVKGQVLRPLTQEKLDDMKNGNVSNLFKEEKAGIPICFVEHGFEEPPCRMIMVEGNHRIASLISRKGINLTSEEKKVMLTVKTVSLCKAEFEVLFEGAPTLLATASFNRRSLDTRILQFLSLTVASEISPTEGRMSRKEEIGFYIDVFASLVTKEEVKQCRKSGQARNKFYDSMAKDEYVPVCTPKHASRDPFIIFLMGSRSQDVVLEYVKAHGQLPSKKYLVRNIYAASLVNDLETARLFTRFSLGTMNQNILFQALDSIKAGKSGTLAEESEEEGEQADQCQEEGPSHALPGRMHAAHSPQPSTSNVDGPQPGLSDEDVDVQPLVIQVPEENILSISQTKSVASIDDVPHGGLVMTSQNFPMSVVTEASLTVLHVDPTAGQIARILSEGDERHFALGSLEGSAIYRAGTLVYAIYGPVVNPGNAHGNPSKLATVFAKHIPGPGKRKEFVVHIVNGTM